MEVDNKVPKNAIKRQTPVVEIWMEDAALPLFAVRLLLMESTSSLLQKVITLSIVDFNWGFK